MATNSKAAAAPVAAPSVKIEDGSNVEAAKNVIKKPKEVSKDTYGNQIESA